MPAGQQTATNHDGQDSEQALLSCFGVSWVGFFKLTAGPVATPPLWSLGAPSLFVSACLSFVEPSM